MGRAFIRYKQNEIRLTAVNFLTGAFLYLHLAGDLTGGRYIYSYHGGVAVLVLLFAGECALCIGSIIAALYQQQYNRRLAEMNSGINRWFLSERTYNYLTAITTILIGFYLVTIPQTEVRSGLATGGIFFQNQRFADAPELFWNLIYFHYALGVLPFIGGALLLIFSSPKLFTNTTELKTI